MTVLLYDALPPGGIPADYVSLNANDRAAYCKGCFGCWLKTPGRCVMADRLETVGSLVMQADTLIIVSRCCYGGYSPNIKKILDRCIPGVMPFFVTKPDENGKREQHHSARYANQMKLRVLFYGAAGEEEQQLAEALVNANGLNYWAQSVNVSFADTVEGLVL